MADTLHAGVQDCTVVILSYNSKDVTDECLTKVEEAVSYAREKLGATIDVVVVDNGSSDGSADMVRERHVGTRLTALHENVGYPKGNNMAMRTITTPYILLLNSDAYVRTTTLADALEYMAGHPEYDILSARLVYPDGSFQASAGYLPTPFRSIRWMFGIESIPIIKYCIRPFHQYKKSFYAHERNLEWASTGFFLLRKKVYDVTHGFDENLFLYMEDVEWCKRIYDNHFTIRYVPQIDIVHLGGFSARKLPTRELVMRHIEGMRYFHKVHYPKTLKLVTLCLVVGMGIRALFYTLILQSHKAAVYWAVMDTLIS